MKIVTISEEIVRENTAHGSSDDDCQSKCGGAHFALMEMLMPCSLFRLVSPGWLSARPFLCKDIAWRRHLAILLFTALSTLLLARSGIGAEPVDAISTGGDDSVTSDVNNPEGSDIAVLEWDPVSHPSLRGYRVYYSPDSFRNFQQLGKVIDVGNATAHTIKGLTSGRRYYFAVTAYGPDEESDSSNVVFKDIP